MRVILAATLIIITLSCNSNKSQQSYYKYCAIQRVYDSLGSTFLQIDTLQFLSGDLATEAAKRREEADTFYTEDHKMHVDVPNDIYIINDTKESLLFKLAKDAKIDLSALQRENVENSVQFIKKLYPDNIFKVSVRGSEIYQIEAIFIP